MKPEKDAFGQFLKANIGQSPAYEIIERDDNFISVMSPDLYFSDYDSWSSHTQSALELAKGRILDVGIGAGRHALYLQDQGHQVIGIDNSPLAVAVASQRGVRDCRVMSLTNISDTLGIFDTVIMLGNNWGLLGSFEQGQHILKRLYDITTDDAKIIAETTNPYSTTQSAHLQYHEQNRQKGRMGGQIRFRMRFQQYCGDWMDYLLTSVDEVNIIINNTGWKLVQTFGDTEHQYTLVLGK